MRSKLTIDFDKKLLKQDGISINQINEDILTIISKFGLKKTSPITYEGGLDGEDGFVDTLGVLMTFLENNSYFLKYINKFLYEDEESNEDLLDDLHRILLEGLDSELNANT